MIWGTLILALLVLAFWRRLHHRYLSLRFKNEVFALRDRLRQLAITKTLNQNHWVFEHFDNTFSKVIAQSYLISVYSLAMLTVKYSSNDRLQIFSSRIDQVCDETPEIRQLREDYERALKRYLSSQHLISSTVLLPIVAIVMGGHWVTKRVNQWLSGAFVYPETSAYRLSY